MNFSLAHAAYDAVKRALFGPALLNAAAYDELLARMLVNETMVLE
jgi:hypothetical protein